MHCLPAQTIVVTLLLMFGWSVRALATEQAGSAGTVEPDHAAKRIKGLELFKSDIRAILKDKC